MSKGVILLLNKDVISYNPSWNSNIIDGIFPKPSNLNPSPPPPIPKLLILLAIPTTVLAILHAPLSLSVGGINTGAPYSGLTPRFSLTLACTDCILVSLAL